MKFSNEVILKRKEQVKNISEKGIRKVMLCSTQCVFFPGEKKRNNFQFDSLLFLSRVL